MEWTTGVALEGVWPLWYNAHAMNYTCIDSFTMHNMYIAADW